MLRPAPCWLSGLMVVTACSWGRYLATGSPKVDENYPSAILGPLLLAAVALGWGLMIFGWRGLLARPPEQPQRLAFAGLLTAALMLPMLSNDVFSVFAYGSLAARGRDVYTNAAGLADSPFFAWVGQRWSEKVCVYGPTALLATLPASLGGSNPWLALLVLRLAWLVPLALLMALSFRVLRDQPFFHAMVWLNPLWVVEGPGQLHSDMLGLMAIVAGMLLQMRGRVGVAWLFYGLAVWSKYSFVLAGPWFWLFGAPAPRQRALRLPLLASAVAVVGALAFVPFWRGLATLTEPIRALADMNPGGSITEIVGTVVHVARGGDIPHPDMPVRVAVELDRATKAQIWFVVSIIVRIVTLGIGVRVLFSMLRRPHDDRRIALGTGVVVVAALTIASHRFLCWYLIAALPFFGLSCPPVWRRWWLWVTALSVSVDFVQLLPPSSPLLPVWSVLTNGGAVIVFLMSFRARYVRFDADVPR